MQRQIDIRFGESSAELSKWLGCDLTDDCPFSTVPLDAPEWWSWIPFGILRARPAPMYTDESWLSYCSLFVTSGGESDVPCREALRNHPARKVLNALRGRRVSRRYSITFDEVPDALDVEIAEAALLHQRVFIPVAEVSIAHSILLICGEGNVYMISQVAFGVYLCGVNVCQGIMNILCDEGVLRVRVDAPESWCFEKSEQEQGCVDLDGNPISLPAEQG